MIYNTVDSLAGLISFFLSSHVTLQIKDTKIKKKKTIKNICTLYSTVFEKNKRANNVAFVCNKLLIINY